MIRNNPKNLKNKRLKKLTRGFKHSNLYKISNQKNIKSLCNQFVFRRLKKRIYRTKWIKFINTQLKKINLRYSLFISSLKKQQIFLNRKVLYFMLVKDLMF